MAHGEISTRGDFFRSSPNEHLDQTDEAVAKKSFFRASPVRPCEEISCDALGKNLGKAKKNHHRFNKRVMDLELSANINTDIGMPLEKKLGNGVECLFLRLNVR